MTMKIENWDLIFAEEIERSRDLEFSWGKNDCITWALQIAFRLTGRDDEPEWFGTYKTEKGGMRVLLKNKIKLAEVGTHYFGDPIENVLFGKRGDLAFSGGAYGIVAGRETIHLSENRGLVTIPLSAATKIWSI